MTTVDFDEAKLTRLKAALKKHVGDDPFEFEGHTYLPSYAKYLVEYLETRFGSKT
jgi:hypothetical protein